ncbi:hypothetical protein HDU92_006982 [Lobulomyces angularis]|nr:hypothetical protein HDU92_006982 [Lobulomyces angularis]
MATIACLNYGTPSNKPRLSFCWVRVDVESHEVSSNFYLNITGYILRTKVLQPPEFLAQAIMDTALRELNQF